MITVGCYSKPEEAHLMRMKLGANGVKAYLRDEFTTQMYWFYSNAIGGVKVEIFEEDEQRAKEILETGDVDTPTAHPCPACASQSTRTNETGRRLSFLSILLLNLPLPVSRFKFVCNDCGHHWKE